MLLSENPLETSGTGSETRMCFTLLCECSVSVCWKSLTGPRCSLMFPSSHERKHSRKLPESPANPDRSEFRASRVCSPCLMSEDPPSALPATDASDESIHRRRSVAMGVNRFSAPSLARWISSWLPSMKRDLRLDRLSVPEG